MNVDQTNKEAWGKEILKNQMLYPNERIVACLAKYYKDRTANRDKKALDIGFGSGRHIKLLLDYGFDTYGFDYSEECVETANSILSDFKDRIHLHKADISDGLYQNGFFDFIICFGVAFLREKKEMVKDLRKIYELLGEGGKMIIDFRTKENSSYKKGKQIGEDTYLLDKSSGSYENMVYTFLDLEQAEEMLREAGFQIENKERIDFWKNNLTEHHSWWIFTVGKC